MVKPAIATINDLLNYQPKNACTGRAGPVAISESSVFMAGLMKLASAARQHSIGSPNVR
jgi:hypothetical protein